MPSRGLHAGGYNEVNAQKMKSVQLPDKIRCQSCKTWKGPNQYSNKQLADLRYKILQFGPLPASGQGQIKCRQCTGQQVVELTCMICNEVKPLSGFGKTHRRDPDNARCSACIDEQAAVQPGLEEVEEEHDSDVTNEYWEDDTVSSTIDSEGGAPLGSVTHALTNLKMAEHDSMIDSSRTSKMSVDGTESTVSGGINATKDLSEFGDGVWTTQIRNKPIQAKPYTAYDSAGLAHSRVRAPSTVDSFESRSTVPLSGSKWRFPKPSRGPSSYTPAQSTTSKTNYNVAASDDDDDDDYRLGDSD
ncbi:hypothetical protein MMC13_005170 [Lambiella insularis]|nr:hypothetical protein [Lambiella insularis]